MGERAAYTHGHDEPVLRAHRARTVENSAAYLAPHLTAGTSVLDVGCGPGTITVDIAALVSPGAVTAVDDAPAAVAATEALIRDRGVENAVVEVADVFALPYAAHSFDVVHAHQVLQHVADPVRALAEMRRVCKPGGIVAARDADYGAMTWHPALPGLEKWRSVYRRIARANGGEPDGGRHLLAWAHRAGFTDVAASASVWLFAEGTERAWWSETWSARIRTTDLFAPALADGSLSSDDILRIADAWNAWGADQDGWFAVLHGEILCRV